MWPTRLQWEWEAGEANLTRCHTEPQLPPGSESGVPAPHCGVPGNTHLSPPLARPPEPVRPRPPSHTCASHTSGSLKLPTCAGVGASVRAAGPPTPSAPHGSRSKAALSPVWLQLRLWSEPPARSVVSRAGLGGDGDWAGPSEGPGQDGRSQERAGPRVRALGALRQTPESESCPATQASPSEGAYPASEGPARTDTVGCP